MRCRGRSSAGCTSSTSCAAPAFETSCGDQQLIEGASARPGEIAAGYRRQVFDAGHASLKPLLCAVRWWNAIVDRHPRRLRRPVGIHPQCVVARTVKTPYGDLDRQQAALVIRVLTRCHWWTTSTMVCWQDSGTAQAGGDRVIRCGKPLARTGCAALARAPHSQRRPPDYVNTSSSTIRFAIRRYANNRRADVPFNKVAALAGQLHRLDEGSVTIPEKRDRSMAHAGRQCRIQRKYVDVLTNISRKTAATSRPLTLVITSPAQQSSPSKPS